MNGKTRTILIRCIGIAIGCFIMGYIHAWIYPFFYTDNTIISEITSLEKELRKQKKMKEVIELQISYRDNDISEIEFDEKKALIAYAEKKKFEQDIKEISQEIERLTQKLERDYGRLRKRHPDFKRAADDKLGIDFAEGE